MPHLCVHNVHLHSACLKLRKKDFVDAFLAEGASIATKAIEYFHENAGGRKLESQTLQNKTSDIDDAFRDK